MLVTACAPFRVDHPRVRYIAAAKSGTGSRELIATQDTNHVIGAGQAFAWNPSITGAKAEQTFVLTDSGPEVVTGSN